MANPIAPMGFAVIGRVGPTSTISTNTYRIPSSDGSAYAVGDAVKIASGADAAGVPNVQKAAGNAASEYIRGVIVGVKVVQDYGTNNTIATTLALETLLIPATKTRDYYVEVCDDPLAIYEIQDDGLNALTAAATNQNAYFTVANPSAPRNLSATTLTTGTVGTGNTLPLKILGLNIRANPLGGNTFGVNANWKVMFNFHDLSAPGRTGV